MIGNFYKSKSFDDTTYFYMVFIFWKISFGVYIFICTHLPALKRVDAKMYLET